MLAAKQSVLQSGPQWRGTHYGGVLFCDGCVDAQVEDGEKNKRKEYTITIHIEQHTPDQKETFQPVTL